MPHPSPRTGLALVLFLLLLLFLPGCLHPIDPIVSGMNASAAVLTQVHDGLEEAHRRARDNAVDLAVDPPHAREAVTQVHASYLPRWAAYDKARAVWIAAAAIVHAALVLDRAGGKPDLDAARAEAVKVAGALAELGAAAKAGAP